MVGEEMNRIYLTPSCGHIATRSLGGLTSDILKDPTCLACGKNSTMADKLGTDRIRDQWKNAK